MLRGGWGGILAEYGLPANRNVLHFAQEDRQLAGRIVVLSEAG